MCFPSAGWLAQGFQAVREGCGEKARLDPENTPPGAEMQTLGASGGCGPGGEQDATRPRNQGEWVGSSSYQSLIPKRKINGRIIKTGNKGRKAAVE